MWISSQGCDSFVFGAILEFTLAQFLMRRQSLKPANGKIEGVSKTSIKKYQVNVESQIKSIKNQASFQLLKSCSDWLRFKHVFENLFQLDSDNDKKLNSFLKIIGLGTYSKPIKGRYDTYYGTRDRRTGIGPATTMNPESGKILEAHWVDEIAKRFFPLAFLIFNIVFWTHVQNQPSIETQLLDEGFIQFR